MTVVRDMDQKRSTPRDWPALLRSVVKTVQREKLFEKGQHLLVALSGGPDSVALLSLLHTCAPAWRLSLSAVHFNYGLRGHESEEDASFVAELCGRLQIPLHSHRLKLGRSEKPARTSSRQEQARDLRYDAMQQLARELHVDRVALGHTADDQAETVLMWMLRGAGLAGLGGMPYRREHLFVRPLLDATRRDILAYLENYALPFRTDSSNSRPIYFRNRIRQELLPVVKELVPAAVRILQRQADVLREEDRFLEQLMSESWPRLVAQHAEGGFSMDRLGLVALPLALQRRLVRQALRCLYPRGKAPGLRTVSTVLNQVVQARPGAYATAGPIRITRDYDRIQFSVGNDETTPIEPVPLAVPSLVRWALTRQFIEAKEVDRSAGLHLLKQPSRNAGLFDADRFTAGLQIRSWRFGDWLCPQGMNGQRKKLQDYYSDIKLPRPARARVPLLISPEGILWVVGYRQDERFRAGAQTRRFVLVTVSNSTSQEGER
jgi:tRNA(Ile)-lysidine synthase